MQGLEKGGMEEEKGVFQGADQAREGGWEVLAEETSTTSSFLHLNALHRAARTLHQ